MRGRVPELDGLRGLAAALVVAFHLRPNLLPWGWVAVDVFFVLSGFLITSIILRESAGPGFFRAFYVRRGLRIWPIYYLAIAALWLTSWVAGADAWPFALYVQNVPLYWSSPSGYFSPEAAPLEHTWSLAVEEQFYLAWPALVVLAGRRGVPWLAGAVWAGAVGARACGFRPILLLSRCDGFAAGALLAVLASDPCRRALAARLAAASAAAAAVLFAALAWARGGDLGVMDWHFPHPTAEVLIAALGSFAVTAMAVLFVGRPWLAPLRSRPLIWLGTVSYGLYLYHVPVIVCLAPRIMPYLGGPSVGFGLPRAAVVVGLTLALAAASWHFIERPILSLKDRFEYGREPDHRAAVEPPRRPAAELAAR